MGRQGFISIRDLLKIAYRSPISYKELGEFAYIVLAERLRDSKEKLMVKNLIESHCNL